MGIQAGALEATGNGAEKLAKTTLSNYPCPFTKNTMEPEDNL